MIFDLLIFILIVLLLVVVALGPLLLVLSTIYFLVTLPLRRMERARMFLDLVENGLNQGQTPEHTVVALSHSRDRSLGARFHLLAARIEMGLRLSEALDRVPRLLPPSMVAMLKTGEAIGDIGKIFPACRRLTNDARSGVRGAFNYLLIVLLVLTPVVPMIYGALQLFVLPRYAQIFDGLFESDPSTAKAGLLIQVSGTLIYFQVILSVLVHLLALLYVGGPRLSGWLSIVLGDSVARISWWLPWRRKRMLRDFSGMLAVLLDGGVPEDKALALAAQSTANTLFTKRAAQAAERLRGGATLIEAVRQLDDSGEFRWRLANASHGPAGFRAALDGWLEALDAKAFQQEQAASQLVTTFLVVINGISVALIGMTLFSPLYEMVTIVALW